MLPASPEEKRLRPLPRERQDTSALYGLRSRREVTGSRGRDAGCWVRIAGSTKGTGSVKDGVEFLKAHDIVVHPRYRHLIDELALYSYRTDPKTGEIPSELDDRENHAVDALRYAIEGLRRGGYDSSIKLVGRVSPRWR
ncbi:terminase large subunit [Inquilinus sp. YAF38]|uniref:terminase large subunit n=1 Tax=Inquilinus sp. YAF38 TaxID=3233084 RepID=UPI003F92AC85